MKLGKGLICLLAAGMVLEGGFSVYAAEQKPAVVAEQKESTKTTVNKVSVEPMIDAKFDECRDFNNGLAAVKEGDKWGYINMKGEWVIKPQYDLANDFSEEKALVFTKETQDEWSQYKVGIVDTKGKYTAVMDGDGPFLVEDIDKGGKQVFFNGYACIKSQGPYMNLISAEGKVIYFNEETEGKMDMVWPRFHPTEGMVPLGSLGLTDEAGAECGYINIKDKKVMVVSSNLDDKGNGKKIISVSPFSGDIAAAYEASIKNFEMVSGSWGFINKQGKMIIAPQYKDFMVNNIFKEFKIFLGDKAIVEDTHDKWGVIDKKGNTVIPFEYDRLVQGEENDPILFGKAGKYGYLDATGKVMIEAIYDSAAPFEKGLAVVKKDGKVSLINEAGETIDVAGEIDMASYVIKTEDNNLFFSPDECLIIKKDNKYGFAKIVRE